VAEYAPPSVPRADVRASAGPGRPVVYYDVVVAHPFATGVLRETCGELVGAKAGAANAIAATEAGKLRD